MKSSFVIAAAAAAGLFAAAPANAGLIITPIFDSSISSDPNASSIEGAINSAIAVYESTFLNPINVSILFQTGPGLGQSDVGYVYNVDYTGFYDALVANNGNPTAIAGLAAHNGNGDTTDANPVDGSSDLLVKSANVRALGGVGAMGLCVPVAAPAGDGVPFECSGQQSDLGNKNKQHVDGIVSLNTGITTPPNPDTAAYYSLQAVVEHEIDEILGLGSGLEDISALSGTAPFLGAFPEDLFRFDGSGHRASFSIDCSSAAPPAVLSFDGTTTVAAFNNSCNGGDFGDFASGPSPQVQDAFTASGSRPTLGAAEIGALTAIGYQTSSVPEPGTFGLLFGGAVTIAVVRRRRA